MSDPIDDNTTRTGVLTGLLRDLSQRGRSRVSTGLDATREHLLRRRLEQDLQHFWVRLGKTAMQLSESGDIEHPAIEKAVRRICELQAEIEGLVGPDTR